MNTSGESEDPVPYVVEDSRAGVGVAFWCVARLLGSVCGGSNVRLEMFESVLVTVSQEAP